MKLIKLSSGELIDGKHDFLGTEEECWGILEDHICDGCYGDLIMGDEWKFGGSTFYDGSMIVRDTLDDLLSTSCGAEFMVED